VSVEAISVDLAVEHQHQSIAGHLRDDRRRGDRRASAIPLARRAGPSADPYPERIDQHDIGSGWSASTARCMARNDA